MVGVRSRLITFNVQHGRTPAGDVDVHLLARSCATLHADVLALQEVDVRLARSDRVDQARVVAEACGMRAVFGEAIARRRGKYGNALLARGPITDVDLQKLPSAEGEPRSAVLATVTLDGGPSLTVAATHLGLHGYAAVQLPVLLAALQDRPAPRVLLGDLNLEPDVVGALATAVGFTVVPSEPTWPAHAPRRRIDHVLLDGPAAVAVDVRQLPVSDHRALVVDVELG